MNTLISNHHSYPAPLNLINLYRDNSGKFVIIRWIIVIMRWNRDNSEEDRDNWNSNRCPCVYFKTNLGVCLTKIRTPFPSMSCKLLDLLFLNPPNPGPERFRKKRNPQIPCPKQFWKKMKSSKSLPRGVLKKTEN